MIKVSILGCDSSHTEAFSWLVNPKGSLFFGEAQIVAIWGEDLEQAEKKAKDCHISFVAATPEEALEQCDFAWILGRYGDSHFVPAMKAIAAGKPMFIDKPVSDSYESAKAILEAANNSKVPFHSFSALRFSEEWMKLKKNIDTRPDHLSLFGPGMIEGLDDQRSMKIHFYGIHLVDLMTDWMGIPSAMDSIIALESSFICRFSFPGKRQADLVFSLDGQEDYGFSVSASGKEVEGKIDPWGNFYENGIRFLLDWAKAGFPFDLNASALAVENVHLLDEIERRRNRS